MVKHLSLIGCAYKVVAKVLANRLSKVISNVISPNQAAFLSGRQILDGVLAANEIFNHANRSGIDLLLFKVKIEKAFDSICWDFLDDVMNQMGFGSKWRRWMRGFLSSATVSVLLNGSPTSEFKMERGLRQGDPLSPFLFLMVAKSLQVTVLEACNKGFFNGIHLGERLENINLSLLQYADDALFFGKWSKNNAINLICILKCFEKASGLRVNLAKSCLYGINVCPDVVKDVALAISCKHGYFRHV